ncbi:MAG: ATP-dependent sacrificial sulfur transferase LarE [Synergistales bacterium]|nr:ATP-dependent sacrificial sulfur transferase LarE [Synergistales bacterium]
MRDKLARSIDEGVISRIEKLASCIVSLSGGLDSAVVLALARRLLKEGKVLAVTFDSWLNPWDEIHEARRLCTVLGVEHMVIRGPELSEGKVLGNERSRCEICKEARIRELISIADSRQIETILDGTNLDDLEDPSRLGNRVLEKYASRIFSPLAEGKLRKEEIWALAGELELDWKGRPSTACLATRFPWNYALDEEQARKTHEAETALLRTGLSRVRVRVFHKMASIEVMPDELEEAFNKRNEYILILKQLGFERINLDLEGYRSGREWLDMNKKRRQGGNS